MNNVNLTPWEYALLRQAYPLNEDTEIAWVQPGTNEVWIPFLAAATFDGHVQGLQFAGVLVRAMICNAGWIHAGYDASRNVLYAWRPAEVQA